MEFQAIINFRVKVYWGQGKLLHISLALLRFLFPGTSLYPLHSSSRQAYKNVSCDKRKYTKAMERSPVGGGHDDTQDITISSPPTPWRVSTGQKRLSPAKISRGYHDHQSCECKDQTTEGEYSEVQWRRKDDT